MKKTVKQSIILGIFSLSFSFFGNAFADETKPDSANKHNKPGKSPVCHWSASKKTWEESRTFSSALNGILVTCAPICRGGSQTIPCNTCKTDEKEKLNREYGWTTHPDCNQ